jgi:type IV secretion system protein VirB1
MFDCPDLAVPREVMQHVVAVESSRNPFAIGVVGGHLARQPRNLEEALAAVRMLRQEGYNFSVGIAQVNRYNLLPYGLRTYAEAFDVCPNLLAGSRILRECYDRSQDWGKAFSCYYSGNFVTGFQHGYVQKIFASMRLMQAGREEGANPRVIPHRSGPRERAREDTLPLGQVPIPPPVDRSAPYPEAYAVRQYLPHTPLEITAAALIGVQPVASLPETAEARPAIPVPGPGAVAPAVDPGAASLSHIPLQVVGVNGNPYQTRVIAPPPPLPGEQLPLPDPNSVSLPSPAVPQRPAVKTIKGGSLLNTPESSGKPESPVASDPPVNGSKPVSDAAGSSDKSFVF